MREMLEELDRIITNKTSQLERLKQGLDAPLVSEYDSYYLVCLARNSLDTWLKCRELLERYQLHRQDCSIRPMSIHFNELMEMEIQRSPGFLKDKTRRAMVDYMKKLEWKLEQMFEV